MTANVSTVPTAPVAGRPCKLVLAATSGNYVRLWCTDAPPGSNLRANLDESGATQVAVGEADAGRQLPFTADKGGAFVFRVEEITRGASVYGGVYDTDPNKAPSEEIVGTPTSVSLYFASPLLSTLGVGQDTVELLVYVLSDEIIPTTIELHGVVSPALRNPRTGLAKRAAESPAVRPALAALVGEASAKRGDIGTWLTNLIAAINEHLADAAAHENVDGDNPIPDAYRYASTTEGQKKSVAAIRRALDNHMRNDNPSAVQSVPPDPPVVIGTGSAAYHDGPGGKVDWANALLPTAPSDQLSVLVSAADSYRAYEAHRVSTVHEAPDAAHVAAVPDALIALHVAFVRQLATQSPVNPTNEHPAKSLLMSGAGFKESNQ